MQRSAANVLQLMDDFYFVMENFCFALFYQIMN